MTNGFLLLDELRIYGRVLTALEVSQLFAPDAIPSPDSPILLAHHLQQSDRQYQQLRDSLQVYREKYNQLEDGFTGVHGHAGPAGISVYLRLEPRRLRCL